MLNPKISSDQYLKLLLQHEIDQPLKVICDFFSADFPKGHHRRLDQWRYFVINDESFSHPHGDPGALLFTYELNIKLLEAAYLLRRKHCSEKEDSNVLPNIHQKQDRH